jgi:hypothetical protein
MRRIAWSLALAAALLALPRAPDARADERSRQAREAAASDAFFARPDVPTLRLDILPEDVQRLRDAPRAYVRARLTEDGGRTYEGVGVKLKGAAGSFRPVDDRPCFTVDLDRYRDGQRFHGMARFHLNNSVQDWTFVHEALATSLFTSAGLVAARAGHAKVVFGGKNLGLFVLKEGMDKRFVARRFGDADGNFYDGGFVRDIDQPLERDSGKGPEDRSDLARIVEACRDPDLARRATRMEEVLDVEAFLTFTALERMLAHWDGYTTNRNNYRLYVRPADGRAVFVPHGTDQLFGDPRFSILDPPPTIVAAAIFSVPALKARYRERLKALRPLFSAKSSLLPRARAVEARLLTAVIAEGPEALANWTGQIRHLHERLAAREVGLDELLAKPEPKPLEFDAEGRATLDGWRAQVEQGEPRMGSEEHAGRPAYVIAAGAGGSSSSWRRRVLLARGGYTFKANVALEDVVPSAHPRGGGLGLRISGANRAQGLGGTLTWREISWDIDVFEDVREVELVAELRAESGTVWFESASMSLVRRAP